ncbi:MAG: MFS transporter [Actinobacteria bacterium]|nr:MFS transporter [Actinomycetota bacterium]
MEDSLTVGATGKKLIAVACAAQFMAMLDVAIVNIALPSIRTQLGFTDAGLQWVVNAYTLALAGCLMLGGRAGDLLGRRTVFLAGIGLFTLSSLGCALADSSGRLIAARAVQGVGGAIVSPASLAILSSSFPEGHARNRALSAWAAMSGFGGSVGMLLGGVLTQAFGWPAIFLINVPAGILVLAFAVGTIPADGPRPAGRRFDVPGAALITAGLSLLVLGIVRSEALGWGSLGVLLPLAAGLALLVVFGLVEWHWASDPLVPPRVLRDPQLRSANLIVILLFLGGFSMWYFLSLYLQQVRGADALEAGLSFLPLTLAVFASTTTAPRAIRALGVRTVLCLGLCGVGAGLLILTGVSPAGSYVTDVLPGGIVATVGLGFALVAATIAALEGAEADEAGLVSGILNTSRLVGGALGLAGFATLATSRTDSLLAGGSNALEALSGGYSAAFLAGGIASLVAAGLALLLIRTSPAADQALLDRVEI